MVCLAFPAAAHAQTVTLAWDANHEPEVIGYLVRYGTVPGVYTQQADAGSQTGMTISNLTAGVTYYFAVEAYTSAGLHSELSAPVFATIGTAATPPAPANPAPPLHPYDIVWQNTTTGGLVTWSMDGLRLRDSVNMTPSKVTDLDWRIVGATDMNGDGSRDLIWQHSVKGWLAVWLMNGSRLIDSIWITPNTVADTNWRINAVGDMDGDGQADLVWRHQGDGTMVVWLMNGPRLRDSAYLSPARVPDLNWQIVGTADMNSDGRTDLVWRHRTQGWLAVWLMNGPRLLDSVEILPNRVADPAWKIVATVDMNGDGSTDLIWRHDTTGELAAWLMKGRQLLDSVYLQPNVVADPNWTVRTSR